MKNLKILAILILVFALLVAVTACGKNEADASADQSSGQQASEQQASEQSISEAQAEVQAATNQQATVEAALPSADSNTSVDTLLGSWVDVNSSDLHADITKTDSGYQWEDNDGKYAATFADGKLKITIAEGDTAEAYIDPATGHMFLVYQENLQEFKKK